VLGHSGSLYHGCTYMSKSRMRLCIDSCTFIVGKARELVQYLLIIFLMILADSMHMLLVFCGCSKTMKKSSNVGFMSMFWFRISLSNDKIVSIRGVRSMTPSQQRRGLLRRLISVISPMGKPQFQDWCAYLCLGMIGVAYVVDGRIQWNRNMMGIGIQRTLNLVVRSCLSAL
jgi:hypothetical protein